MAQELRAAFVGSAPAEEEQEQQEQKQRASPANNVD